jgi:hypothetical protein
VQLVTFTEGLCVQALHRGPYAEEPKTLAQMDAHMRNAGLVPNGLLLRLRPKRNEEAGRAPPPLSD